MRRSAAHRRLCRTRLALAVQSALATWAALATRAARRRAMASLALASARCWPTASPRAPPHPTTHPCLVHLWMRARLVTGCCSEWDGVPAKAWARPRDACDPSRRTSSRTTDARACARRTSDRDGQCRVRRGSSTPRSATGDGCKREARVGRRAESLSKHSRLLVQPVQGSIVCSQWCSATVVSMYVQPLRGPSM